MKKLYNFINFIIFFGVIYKISAQAIVIGPELTTDKLNLNNTLKFPNSILNRKIVLFDAANNDHQYTGLGINSNTFRYQVGALTDNHVFYAGNGTNNSNELMRIAGNGAVSIGTNNNTAQLSIADNKFTNGLLIDALNTPGGNALKVIGTANITGNTNLDNNLIVEGATDIGGATTIGGNLSVSGTLSKGSGTFKIDHPIDPENKYLYHSFIESPDMMNIYNGNIITNNEGIATVALPSYFEGLNSDFRYQLTVIGTFAQAIVAEKVKNNQFIIKTNAPNIEVSWMVTGIRKDAFANKNRVKVEVEKSSNEKGYYLHPEAFGWGEEKSISKSKNKIQ